MKSLLKLPYDTEPHNWFSLTNSLLGLLPHVPRDKAPPEAAWSPGATLKETQENYRRAERPFEPEIEDVIRTLCETGSARIPSKAVGYFIGERSIVLGVFLMKLSIRAGPHGYLTIIPHPSLPMPAVMQWFLIEWWAAQGPCELSFQYHGTLSHMGLWLALGGPEEDANGRN